MIDDKLKPCPFCGGEAEMTGSCFAEIYHIDCSECGFGTCDFTIKSEATEKWNRRIKKVEGDEMTDEQMEKFLNVNGDFDIPKKVESDK